MIGPGGRGPAQTDLIKSGSLDAFGRYIFAEYRAETAWKFSDNINTNLFSITEENGGTVTWENGEAKLQSNTNPNGRAKIETKKLVIYQPGYAGEATFTFNFGTPQENSSQLVGLGNDDDGLFFGYSGLTFGVFRRSNGIDYLVSTDEISEELFYGYNPQLGNVYKIAYQWLGYGEIRYFLEFPKIGAFSLIHKIEYANSANETTLRNPSLPLMAEIKNTGNTTNIIATTPSATAGVYGPKNDALVTLDSLEVLDSQILASTFTEKPLISLKNNTDYAGGTGNNRTPIRVDEISIAATNPAIRTVIIKLYKNGSLTGSVFADISTNTTPGQKDTTATAITGGHIIKSFPILANAGSKDKDFGKPEIIIYPGEILTITAQATQTIALITATIAYSNLF